MSAKDIIGQVRKNAPKQRGASLVEYALLVSLIAIASMVILGNLGDTIEGRFEAINTQIGVDGGGAGGAGGAGG